MHKASNAKHCTSLIAAMLICMAPRYALAQGQPPQVQLNDKSENARPVTLRVGVPNKHSDREVVFPLVIETSGAASVGRIRAELELSALEGWSFRGVDITRGLDLQSKVRKRNEGADKLVIDWDVSGEGKELPTGHVALFRVQADKRKTGTTSAPSDNPPTLLVRKMSWGLAEFEKQPESSPQLDAPDNLNGNPDVSCFFFTH
jgi:hypothetical protein